MHFRVCRQASRFVKIPLMRSFPGPIIALLVLCPLVCLPAWGQQLQCKPCSYNFGKVQVGKSTGGFIILKNTGAKTLRIISNSISGDGFSFGDLQLPKKLKPGATVEMPLTFAPTDVGHAGGVVSVVSDDPDSPLTMGVHGFGLAKKTRQLGISPATLNFGSVAVGSTASLPAVLTASSAAVTISSDESGSSEFSITGLTLPVRIRAGQSVQAMIQFKPNASGTATTQATFFSNAIDSPTTEQLTGTGTAQGSHDAYLTWEAGDPDAIGYNIYRSTVHGGPYEQINGSLDSATNYTDYGVVGGKTYYYVATEVNSQGEESGFSNETKTKIPNK
jgi:hypothetical protein